MGYPSPSPMESRGSSSSSVARLYVDICTGRSVNGGAQWLGVEEEEEEGGRGRDKGYAPLKATSSCGELNPERLWGGKALNKRRRKVMESNKGWSQELSKARTRLAFPRGRVVQPPLWPGKTPVPPPPAPPRGEGPLYPVPGTAGVPATGERPAADKMAFHPEPTGLLVLYAPPANRAHPETPLRAPMGHSTLAAGCRRAPCPLLVPRALPRASARLLSHPPVEKQGETSWVGSRPLSCRLFPSPLAQPCYPAGLSPAGQNNRLPAAADGSTPKPTPTPVTKGPSGAGHIRLPCRAAQGGGLHHPTVPIPLPPSPKGR